MASKILSTRFEPSIVSQSLKRVFEFGVEAVAASDDFVNLLFGGEVL